MDASLSKRIEAGALPVERAMSVPVAQLVEPRCVGLSPTRYHKGEQNAWFGDPGQALPETKVLSCCGLMQEIRLHHTKYFL